MCMHRPGRRLRLLRLRVHQARRQLLLCQRRVRGVPIPPAAAALAAAAAPASAVQDAATPASAAAAACGEMCARLALYGRCPAMDCGDPMQAMSHRDRET